MTPKSRLSVWLEELGLVAAGVFERFIVDELDVDGLPASSRKTIPTAARYRRPVVLVEMLAVLLEVISAEWLILH